MCIKHDLAELAIDTEDSPVAPILKKIRTLRKYFGTDVEKFDELQEQNAVKGSGKRFWR